MTAPVVPIESVQRRGVPAWMAALGIKPGEFICLTKAQLYSLIRPGKPLKEQFWAMGMLHTAGYQGELAVRMVNGVQTPMTPAQLSVVLVDHWLRYFERGGIDTEPLIGKAPQKLLDRFDQPLSEKDQRFIKRALLRIPKEDLRSIMEELEREGVMERRLNDGRSLQEIPLEKRKLVSGRVRLSFFAQPRPVDPKVVKAEWAYTISSLCTPDTSDIDGEVGKNSLPFPSVPQIVRGFGLQVERKLLAHPLYRKAVEDAYIEAKKIFVERVELAAKAIPLEEPEVGNTALPVVGNSAPPEVGKNGERFERKVERNVERYRAPSSSTEPTVAPVEASAIEKAKGSTTTPLPQEVYASDRDELIALMKATTGRLPATELVRKINETLEIRQISLRWYLDDIKPRLERLNTPAREGFYYRHAQRCGTAEEQPAAAPETAEQKAKRTGPCMDCRGLGKIGEAYCECQMGIDLKRVERRKVAAGGEA